MPHDAIMLLGGVISGFMMGWALRGILMERK